VPTFPKIHVISLVAALERRTFMHQQLQPLGVSYEFFNAIHGVKNPDFHLFKKYNDKKRARLRGANVSLTLGQLGCFASHYLLWEKCVDRGEPIIVLEDDAILLPTFTQFINNAEEFSRHYGLVWMQPSRKIANQAGYVLGKIGPFTVKKFAKGFSGTTGYLITPQTAQTLLNYCTEWVYPVDITMDRFYSHKIESIGIDPVCVRQDDELESFINETNPNKKRTLQDTLRREYAAAKDSLRRSVHNLMFVVKLKLSWTNAARADQSEASVGQASRPD